MKTLRLPLLAASLLASSLLWAADLKLDASQYVTREIQVEGAVEQPLTLDVAALRAFPAQQISELKLICQSGADRGSLQNFKGVLLRDVLEKAKIKAPAHNDVKKMIIQATASDGYVALFSWNELFNSKLGDGVLVVFEQNGKGLGIEEGHIALVSSQDTRTGPRHVKWLKKLSVRKVVD